MRDDLLFTSRRENSILQSALPLVLHPRDLVICAKHDLADGVFGVVVFCNQIIGVIEIGIDGVFIIFVLVIIPAGTIDLSLGHAGYRRRHLRRALAFFERDKKAASFVLEHALCQMLPKSSVGFSALTFGGFTSACHFRLPFGQGIIGSAVRLRVVHVRLGDGSIAVFLLDLRVLTVRHGRQSVLRTLLTGHGHRRLRLGLKLTDRVGGCRTVSLMKHVGSALACGLRIGRVSRHHVIWRQRLAIDARLGFDVRGLSHGVGGANGRRGLQRRDGRGH